MTDRSSRTWTLALAGLGMLAAAPAFGQTAAPDAGSILRDIERTTPRLGKPPAPVEPLPPSEQEAPPLKQGQTVHVTDIHIVATVFPEATLKELVKDYIGRDCTLGDLREAAAKIAKYYRDHDRLAHAYLPQQTIHNGMVEIVVVEGRLGAVSVDKTTPSRLEPDIAIGRVLARQEAGAPLRPSALEEGMSSLNSLPGVSATAALVPGKNVGESDVVLRLRDTPLVTGDVAVDNASPQAIGSWRGVGQAAFNDAFGRGDLEQFAVVKSGGSQFGRAAFAVPVTRSGLTVGASVSYLDFTVDKDFNASQPSGTALSAGASATHPLFRSETSIADVSLAYEHRRITNQTAGVTTSDNLLDIAAVAVTGSWQDSFLGGGINTYSASASVGNLTLRLGADVDSVTTHSAGAYGKLNVGITRLHPLTPKLELLLSLSAQWAPQNLDSSEKFSLGGPGGVRAYPINEANGDDGWLTVAELRYRLFDRFKIGAFFDTGGIVQHVNTWPDWQGGGSQPNQYELYGTGLFALWSPIPAITIKGTVAQVLGSNPGRTPGGYDADGERQRTRFWLQLSAHF